MSRTAAATPRKKIDLNAIRLRGVRQNNLKNIDVDIPLGQLTVITGVSGSGKSTLAFDVLYAEGQRRYVSSFSSYTRQFLERLPAPEAESISEVPPAIALRPTGPGRTARSTVGTLTEILDHLQLLYAKESRLQCPKCQKPVLPKTRESLTEELIEQHADDRLRITFRVPLGQKTVDEMVVQGLESAGFLRVLVEGKEKRVANLKGLELQEPELEVVVDRLRPTKRQRHRVAEALELALEKGKGWAFARGDESSRELTLGLTCESCATSFRSPVPAHFSFNNPLGACPDCRGFGREIIIDPNRVVPNANLTLKDHAIKPLSSKRFTREYREMLGFCREKKIPTDVPYRTLSEKQHRFLWDGGSSFCGIHALFEWLETKSYKMHVRIMLARYRGYATCRTCLGTRLKESALKYEIGGLNFAELCRLPAIEARDHLRECQPSFAAPLQSVFKRIDRRLETLVDVGLEYLSLDRLARTLSGGEAQRVHLTAALGTSLAATLFVLDEPSVGLHARDSRRLVRVLKSLRDSGNTVVVVEHDPEIIQAADTLIDLGPAAGELGGELIFQGSPKKVLSHKKSATGAALRGELPDPRPKERRAPDQDLLLQVRGATAHNLAHLDLDIPLKSFVTVCGVSGSGKSTLVDDVIYAHLARDAGEAVDEIGACESLAFVGPKWPAVRVDQSPPGRSSRSNPATYVGAWDIIRKIFGAEADKVGLEGGARLFSFNVAGGRCEECKGEGAEIVDMQFLADVRMTCPTCGGKRFSSEVLDVRWRGLSIAEVLNMTVLDALDRFEDYPKLLSALRPLDDIGLSYLRLGQPTSTLSGGEAQRLKMAKHLSEAEGDPTLFILDEPTTGLHLSDVSVLIEALKQVVAKGHSILVVEHHVDLIVAADWVFELGPEGGPKGGELIAMGPPERIAAGDSPTGRALAQWMKEHATS